jgi:hypothetical protein
LASKAYPYRTIVNFLSKERETPTSLDFDPALSFPVPLASGKTGEWRWHPWAARVLRNEIGDHPAKWVEKMTNPMTTIAILTLAKTWHENETNQLRCPFVSMN